MLLSQTTGGVRGSAVRLSVGASYVLYPHLDAFRQLTKSALKSKAKAAAQPQGGAVKEAAKDVNNP